MSITILVVEDDPRLRPNIAELLGEEGFTVITADNGSDGIALARARRPDLMICDIVLPGLDGHEVLRAVRSDPVLAPCPFIFLTARSERADLRAGMDLGADDYVTKPFSLAELVSAVRSRLARVQSVHSRSKQAAERESGRRSGPPAAFAAADGVVVNDPRMQALYREAEQVATSSISVLILGETGVGKEIFARAIHNVSRRRSGPFLALNCGALSESLLEAELFGHEKGAFTGAFQARAGLFESANGGTLFLDEIGELPAATQSKLLRALEERQVLRVGARAPKSIDVRFLAATNRDIEIEIKSGRFRRDLYYRLCGVNFTLPPLRERRAEILPLAQMFAARACAEQEREPCELALETARLLEQHDWPGNVRELRHAVERAVALCSEDTLLPAHLPAWHPPSPDPPSSSSATLYSQYRDAAREEDRQRIVAALEEGRTQADAAELLGISRRKLVYRMRELDILGPRKRPPESE